MRLAEEYDAAQDRGEVATAGANQHQVVVSANDLGLRRDEVHEARRLRDAEAAEPGLIERSISRMLERGEEPTRARAMPRPLRYGLYGGPTVALAPFPLPP